MLPDSTDLDSNHEKRLEIDTGNMTGLNSMKVKNKKPFTIEKFVSHILKRRTPHPLSCRLILCTQARHRWLRNQRSFGPDLTGAITGNDQRTETSLEKLGSGGHAR